MLLTLDHHHILILTAVRLSLKCFDDFIMDVFKHTVFVGSTHVCSYVH